jgi:ribosomal RNA assembly protein
MIKLFCEKIQRIIKNRERLEKKLGIKITYRGREITIHGPAEDEYIAEKVIEALDFGFPFSVALLIEEEDYILEILNIKNYTKRKDLERIRARIIGKEGKALRTFQGLTKCYFEIKGNSIAIVGDPEYIRNAQEAMISVMRGAKHSNVYTFLEQHQIKPVIDLGLKPVKKPKRKKK